MALDAVSLTVLGMPASLGSPAFDVLVFGLVSTR